MKSIILFVALFASSSSAWAHASTSNAFLHVLHHASLYFGIGVLIGAACLLVVRTILRKPQASHGSVKI